MGLQDPVPSLGVWKEVEMVKDDLGERPYSTILVAAIFEAWRLRNISESRNGSTICAPPARQGALK